MKKKNRRLTLAFDRLLSRSLAKQLLILVGVMVILFALSHIALNLAGDDWKTYCDQKHISRWVFPLYLLIDANAFNDLYTAENHQISKLTIAISGITFVAGILLFTGALISILTNVISQRVEKHDDGLLHYLKSGHYIIMGYDDMASSVIKNIFDKDPKAYILLLSAVDAKILHEKLRKSLSNEQIDHVIINYGLRISKEFYEDIHLESAEEIFIVGLRTYPIHDAMNIECIDSICSYLSEHKTKKMPKRLTCIFEDLDTYRAFKTSEIFNEVKNLGIEFIPYNFYTTWAKQVLIEGQYKGKNEAVIQYPSIYGNGITDEDGKFVHIVFVGTTYFSVAFAMEAAQLLHFPNFHKRNLRTRITFIDKKADEEMPVFLTRNRHFFETQSYIYRDMTVNTNKNDRHCRLSFDGLKDTDFLDIEFEFIKGDVFSERVQEEIRRWSKERNRRYLSIFLALANSSDNFIMGMNMPDEVYDNEIPVFIRQDRSDNFIYHLRTADPTNPDDRKGGDLMYYHVKDGELCSEPRKDRYTKLYPFGMNNISFSYDLVSIKRAKLINFLYNTADYSTLRFTDYTVLAAMGNDQIWRKADEFWGNLSIALKWSNLYCAYSIQIKAATLRAMRGLPFGDTSRDYDELSQKEMEEIAIVEHNRWNVEKLLMGYRKAKQEEDKYEHPGSAKQLKKNKLIFIHHDIRPFEDLDTVRQLDYEIAKYIPWILKMTEQ